VPVQGLPGDAEFLAELANLGSWLSHGGHGQADFAGVILNGRPPFRPRARAEARPAMVRSEMSSRSNSARAAKIPKTSFPEAVGVSMAAPWPVRTLSPILRSVRSWTMLTR
jgi:hypothetical protein